VSNPRVDWCSYCKAYKDPTWGDYFGPHDTFFMCSDCIIEQGILQIEDNLQKIKLILRNRKNQKINP
jgi:hypothetical protein